MQRPPGRIGPILSRSPNEWINRVNERYKVFAALKVTIDERRHLDTWLASRFVAATLRTDQAPFVIAHLTNALREAMRLASVEGGQARLTPALLIQLSGAGLRTHDDSANRSSDQMPAAHLARAIENACDWFAAESFDELNPVEQAAIVFLRLTTIQPFEQANEATALVAASLFTLRAGLPPMIIKPEMQLDYDKALVEAGQMEMQPLVELMAGAISSTLDEMTEFVKQSRGGRL